jgi:hypothetical protein
MRLLLLPRRIPVVKTDGPREPDAAAILDALHHQHRDQQCLSVSRPSLPRRAFRD